MRCIKLCLAIIIELLVLQKTAANGREMKVKMVSIGDLKYYVNALDNVASFTGLQTTYDESLPNFMAGIFFANVNLKRILRDKLDRRAPFLISRQLHQISARFDRLLNIFNQTSITSLWKEKIPIKRLFESSSAWASNLPSYKKLHPPIPLSDESSTRLAQTYNNFEDYVHDIGNVDEFLPSPAMSDECLIALSSYIKYDQSPSRCELPYKCDLVIKQGSNFGYALSHRIFLLTIANLGPRCTIFSEEQDRHLMRQLCAQAYDECRYIAMNGYRVFDLMVENMAICSFAGHSEFLRQDWMREVLRHQTSAGCFLDVGHETSGDVHCDPHSTAVAVSALGTAIRWILEHIDFLAREGTYEEFNKIILKDYRYL